jgi:hypothetical protein
MLGKLLAWFVCGLAILLPWRLRVLYADLIGWLVQFLYFTYYGILNFLLAELRKAKEEKKDAG